MNKFLIRKATNEDSKQLVSLFKFHAEYEGCEFNEQYQESALENLCDHPMQIFVVELLYDEYTGDEKISGEPTDDEKAKLKGYLSVIKQFSTWDMEHYLYMDCLYLKPEVRGKWLGKQLMNTAKIYADYIGVSQLQWQTPVENTKAISFYNSLGATQKNKQRFYWG